MYAVSKLRLYSKPEHICAVRCHVWQSNFACFHFVAHQIGQKQGGNKKQRRKIRTPEKEE